MTVLQYDAEDLNHAAAMAGSNNNNGEGGTAMGSGHAATAAVAVGGLNRGRTVAGSPGKPRNMRTFYTVRLTTSKFTASSQVSTSTTRSGSRWW